MVILHGHIWINVLAPVRTSEGLKVYWGIEEQIPLTSVLVVGLLGVQTPSSSNPLY